MYDDHPVGYVALRGLEHATCEMNRLFILPEYRAQGVGKRLAEKLVVRAARLGYSRRVLDTLPEMAAAIRMYRALGFKETERSWDNPIERTVYLDKRVGAVEQLKGKEPKL
jgi:carbonic anhydrase